MEGPGLLVSSDIVERALRTPGARVAPGSFLPPTMTDRVQHLPLPRDLEALVAAFRVMLRDVTAINVRQPSTLAPPFRALNWYSRVPVRLDESFGADLVGTTGAFAFNGNDSVPQGVNAVLTAVNLFLMRAQANNNISDPYDTGSTPSSQPVRIDLLIDGVTVPGFSGRLAEVVYQTTVAGVPDETVGTHHRMLPLAAPVPLIAGQVLSFIARGRNTANVIGFAEATGYMYPVELSSDGLRGTLADRGTE